MYKIPCGCKNVPPYIGQTKLKINTRTTQHNEYVRKEQWDRSGIAQHARTCHSTPNFDETRTVKVEYNTFNRRVRESLEIQKHESGPDKGGMNQDDGMYLKTKFWIPFLREINKFEKKSEMKQKQQEQRQNADTSFSNEREDNTVA